MFQRRSQICGFLFAIAVQTAVAQAANVEVTIQAVRPEAKEITVAYQTGLGEKSITLDVNRKAEITLNGTEVDLESLGPGLEATVEYHKELAVVTKITATGQTRAAPELLEVSELNPGGLPWLSEDGLTIYWSDEDGICTASRKDANAFFTNKRVLFKGSMPTLSQDGLCMLLFIDGAFYSTTRATVEDPFERPRLIRELQDQDRPWNPCLSPDGLTIYFNRRRLEPDGNRPYEFAFSTRSSRNAPWTKPESLPMKRDEIVGNLVWLYVVPDGLSLYCSHVAREDKFEKGNLMVWWRADMSEPFSNHSYIEIDGLPPLVGTSARYVAATNELFFTREYPKDSEKKGGIWVVKNFVPPLPSHE